MGRILLAHLPEPELDAYLRRTTMRKLTEQTITDEGKLREVLAEAPQPWLGRGGPGA